MKNIVFYEKPGCVGNQAQKTLLRDAGYRLEVKNLLENNWTTSELRSFFGNKPVNRWFNQSAPKIKSGAIDINGLDEQQAIKLMLAEPLLICRPLLQYGDLKQSGFVPGPVLTALEFILDSEQDLQSCPMAEDMPEEVSACGETL